jgi:hypothetical protein
MSEIRIPKRRGYTVIRNDQLPTGQMSMQAWGLYSYLLSRKSDWIVREKQLMQVFRNGRDAIRAARDELVQLGLLQREEYVENGLRRVQYTLTTGDEDVRVDPKAPRSDFQRVGNPRVGNPPHSHYGEEPTTDDSQSEETTTSAAALRANDATTTDFRPDRNHRKLASDLDLNVDVMAAEFVSFAQREDIPRERWGGAFTGFLRNQGNDKPTGNDLAGTRWATYMTRCAGCEEYVTVDATTDKLTEPHRCSTAASKARHPSRG